MKTNKIHYSIIVVFTILLGLTLVLIADQGVDDKKDKDAKKGLVTYTDGRVKKKPLTTEDWENAEKNTPVNTGERMRTYTRSRAELELLQLDIIRMAPETTIDIVKLYEETKEKKTETELTLKEGDIWAQIGKKDASMTFDIGTPIAAAAITGTVLRMGVKTDSTTELRVYTGEVQITNAPEKTGIAPQYIMGKPTEVPGPYEVQGPHEVSMEEWIYIVKNMQKIVIGNNGQIKSMGDFSKKDPDEQTDWIKWNLERDRMMTK